MKKQTPLLMCGEMVRATLRQQNPKTQTRRIMNPQPSEGFQPEVGRYHPTKVDRRTGELYPGAELFGAHDIDEDYPCRYGQPGDLIWVKETHSKDFANHYPNDPVWYRADRAHWEDIEHRNGVQGVYSPEEKVFVPFKWKPSIFMQRHHSRITLEIAEIRVERLQDISEADALAEGIFECWPGAFHWRETCISAGETAVLAYRALWNSLNLKPKPIYETDEENGKKCIVAYEAFPWSDASFDAEYPACREGCTYRGLPLTLTANPWVWVISFKRIKP